MLFDQNPASLYHVLRLGLVQADALDIFSQFFFAQVQYRFRRVRDRIQMSCGSIDANIGRLCREHHGYQ